MDLIFTEKADLGLASNSTGNDTLPGTLYHLRVGLFQDDITITRSTTKAELDSASCTFVGYGVDTVTWDSPSRADDGNIEVLGPLSVWRPTNGVTPNNAWGLYAWDSANDLIFAGRFDSPPLPLADELDQIQVTLRYRPVSTGIAAVVS